MADTCFVLHVSILLLLVMQIPVMFWHTLLVTLLQVQCSRKDGIRDGFWASFRWTVCTELPSKRQQQVGCRHDAWHAIRRLCMVFFHRTPDLQSQAMKAYAQQLNQFPRLSLT